MGSLSPEAGPGRKPPRGTAAPRYGARAPAFSGTGSSAKGGRGQPAGSPPRSLSWPRAGGRVHPPGEGRCGERARERAGTARARRASAARAPPPGKQRARASPPRPPLPPRSPRNLLTARPGGAQPGGGGGRLQRAGVSRVPSASPGARALAQPSSHHPPLFSEGAGRRHPPAGARHCTTPSDFQCSTLPGQSLLGFFFSLPPLPPPTAASISLRKGFFLSPSPTP
ncbi:ubiquitin-conjugating enzyme E2 E3 isoform X1 [Symphalangus syndactylus]|uniref:ubiquitin-conjugating enzyme E2 E3 isoform X1 n=1 Tax=Symphalangus syndactylus TaxID=9590 RepID=UPI0030061994